MSKPHLIIVLAIGSLVLTARNLAADEPPPGNHNIPRDVAPTVDSLRRDALLTRFDVDKDGALNDLERTALREAFGSVDVPMLPQQPYDYVSVRIPKHIEAAHLAHCDSSTADNPLTNPGAELGRVLFHDRQLSKNKTVSCAACHGKKFGFSDPKPFSLGFKGGQTTRNSMGLANLRYTKFKSANPGFFWDERAATLEAQVLMPIQDKVEMGMDLTELEAKLGKIPYYPPLFAAAFGSPEVTRDRIAKAVAQFIRAMIALDAKFDRAADAAGVVGNYSVPFDKFTDQENLGKSLFIDGIGGVAEMGCAHCHIPPTFGMPQAFNNGLDLKSKDQGLGALGRPSNDPFTPSNDGKFKASSLRNIALTAPYMHDGRFKTLEEVVEHYSRRIHPHENLGLAFGDQQAAGDTTGFQMTDEQKAALVAFMNTLTDESLLKDPKFSDPFVRLKAVK